MAGSDRSPDEQAEAEEPSGEAEEPSGGAEEPSGGAEEPVAPVARRGPVWVILGVAAAALLICCCSAVVGLVLSWSAGLFDNPPG